MANNQLIKPCSNNIAGGAANQTVFVPQFCFLYITSFPLSINVTLPDGGVRHSELFLASLALKLQIKLVKICETRVIVILSFNRTSQAWKVSRILIMMGRLVTSDQGAGPGSIIP
jgi:hypothetical protein